MPAISVLMPALNAGDYIGAAARSLTRQTFTDWELVLVDDGSSDNSVAAVRDVVPARQLKVIQHASSAGVGRSLNAGLAVAAGSFVARMDADDIAHPERLRWQYQTLRDNPRLEASFGWYQLISSEGTKLPTPALVGPVSEASLRPALFLGNPLCHPTACFNRALSSEWRYPADQQYEDYALWLERVQTWRFHVDPRTMLSWRMHRRQQSRARVRDGNDQLLSTFRRALTAHGIALEPRLARLMLRPDDSLCTDSFMDVVQIQRGLRREVAATGEAAAGSLALRMQMQWTFLALRRTSARTASVVLRRLDSSERSMLTRLFALAMRLKMSGTMRRALAHPA